MPEDWGGAGAAFPAAASHCALLRPRATPLYQLFEAHYEES